MPHDDLGKSIATVQVLQRKHETFEREVTALGNKVHNIIQSQLCVHWAKIPFICLWPELTSYNTHVAIYMGGGSCIILVWLHWLFTFIPDIRTIYSLKTWGDAYFTRSQTDTHTRARMLCLIIALDLIFSGRIRPCASQLSISRTRH